MFLHLFVSHSVHKGGEVYTPWADTPMQTSTPLARHSPWVDTLPGQTPHRQTTPRQTSPLARHIPRQTPPRRSLQRTVRILLECILVVKKFWKTNSIGLTLTFALVSSQGPGMPFCSNLFRRHQSHTEGTNYWKCQLRRVGRRRRVSETNLTLIALGISTLNPEVGDFLNGSVL